VSLCDGDVLGAASPLVELPTGAPSVVTAGAEVSDPPHPTNALATINVSTIRLFIFED
jgi:hypothetical protein